MHLVLAAPDSRDALQRELEGAVLSAEELRGGMFALRSDSSLGTPLPRLAFARQFLVDARPFEAESIRLLAGAIFDTVELLVPDEQPWSLHVFPLHEQLGPTRVGARAWHSLSRAGRASVSGRAAPVANAAGQNRCELVRQALVELVVKRRRHLARYLREHVGPFWHDETLVQVLLTAPNQGFVSVAAAPLPFQQRHALACFPGGEVAVAVDKQAPSRAFAKLVEAEMRMGRRIGARESCVDLGAAPGSWTYVAVRRGARVTAVDRAELQLDLMQHPQVRFEAGDAFRFEPSQPFDWLLCDVIASAERSAELLVRWLRSGFCRNFVVTLKVDDTGSNTVLRSLQRELHELTRDFWLLRLSANKKEVCAFGAATASDDSGGQ